MRDLGGIWIVLIFTGLDLYAVLKRRLKLQYISKPAVLISLIVWTLTRPIDYGGLTWLIIGLAFCLLGDILLLLPARSFLFGLGSFLIGHIAYSIFFQPWLGFTAGWIILFAGAVVLSGGLYLKKLWPHLITKRGARRLRILVICYCLVLSIMVISAASTLNQPSWPQSSAAIASMGAMFFYLSDCLLGYDRFVSPFWGARFFVRSTYYLGQVLLVAAAVSRFS